MVIWTSSSIHCKPEPFSVIDPHRWRLFEVSNLEGAGSVVPSSLRRDAEWDTLGQGKKSSYDADCFSQKSRYGYDPSTRSVNDYQLDERHRKRFTSVMPRLRIF